MSEKKKEWWLLEGRSDPLLHYPTKITKNKKGETIFSLKRKEKDGKIWYLFEFHEDRVDDPNQLAKLNKWFNWAKLTAARVGIAFYDVDEILEAIEKQKKKECEAIPIGKTKDIRISVLDHASGEMHSLVLGITRKSPEEKKVKF